MYTYKGKYLIIYISVYMYIHAHVYICVCIDASGWSMFLCTSNALAFIKGIYKYS
jgi:hypothetical protein